MTIERKLLGTSPSGGATDVAEVFSTDLYTGNDTDRDIVNGIDLAGEGGLVWIKSRQASFTHMLVDSEYTLGAGNYGNTASTSGNDSGPVINTFNSNGFNLDSNWYGNSAHTSYGGKYVAWTFRKKEKFLDIVGYSGNGSDRTITHSLGSTPAMIIVQCTTAAKGWGVYHKDLNTNSQYLNLNESNPVRSDQGRWADTAPTDTVFSLGGSSQVNGSGNSYVAFLFADNSSEDLEEQMIKCGSYQRGVTSVNLGWEPQFLLQKVAISAGSYDWQIVDSMRGIVDTHDGDRLLKPNGTNAEFGDNACNLTATGLGGSPHAGGSSGDTVIYMAIRAPMMIEPEAATDVFAVKSYTGIGGNRTLDAAFGPVDMAIAKRLADSSAAINLTTRLTSKEFSTNVGDPEGSFNFVNLESNSLVVPGSYFSNSSGIPYGLWAWKRAKGFFDVVAYDGTDTYRWQSHSLGAVPEMIWVKGRTADVSWAVYHKDVGSSKYLMLNDDAGQISSSSRWGASDPTDSLFRLGSSSMVNAASDTYVAYLFTTLDGISKCGSYVGNGTNQIIDCGFSAGARLILIKPSSTSGAWYLWDSARGIVAGGDPHLMLHSTAGQITGDDSVDPHNSGFKVNQIANTGINVSSTTYIFYAIA